MSLSQIWIMQIISLFNQGNSMNGRRKEQEELKLIITEIYVMYGKKK